jgi:hypothetical protein
MRRLTFALVGVCALAVFAAGGNATPPPPLGVSFVVSETFNQGGPFTASGFAVDAGVICSAGDTVDLGEKVAPNNGQTGQGLNILAYKRFTCTEGGSGTFDVKLTVRINKAGDTFNWSIIAGTGAYATLRGSGQGYGINPTSPPPDVTDYYFGTVHS